MGVKDGSLPTRPVLTPGGSAFGSTTHDAVHGAAHLKSASARFLEAAPRRGCRVWSDGAGRSRSWSGARTSMANLPSGTGMSTAPFQTQSSRPSSTTSRADSRRSTVRPWPTSSTSSTTFPSRQMRSFPHRWTPSGTHRPARRCRREPANCSNWAYNNAQMSNYVSASTWDRSPPPISRQRPPPRRCRARGTVTHVKPARTSG